MKITIRGKHVDNCPGLNETLIFEIKVLKKRNTSTLWYREKEQSLERTLKLYDGDKLAWFDGELCKGAIKLNETNKKKILESLLTNHQMFDIEIDTDNPLVSKKVTFVITDEPLLLNHAMKNWNSSHIEGLDEKVYENTINCVAALKNKIDKKVITIDQAKACYTKKVDKIVQPQNQKFLNILKQKLEERNINFDFSQFKPSDIESWDRDNLEALLESSNTTCPMDCYPTTEEYPEIRKPDHPMRMEVSNVPESTFGKSSQRRARR